VIYFQNFYFPIYVFFLSACTLPSCHIEKLFETHSTEVKYERDGRQMGERERKLVNMCVAIPDRAFAKSTVH